MHLDVPANPIRCCRPSAECSSGRAYWNGEHETPRIRPEDHEARILREQTRVEAEQIALGYDLEAMREAGQSQALTATEVEAIRHDLKQGMSFTLIGKRNGVSRTTVSKIARGKYRCRKESA